MNRREFVAGSLATAALFKPGEALAQTPPASGARILVFDTFGTVVDWRGSVIAEGERLGKGKGLTVGKVGRLYSARIPVSGKDAKTAQFAISGKIPPGLELDETTGRLTGTLLKAGNYRLRVFAFSENGAPISKVFRLRVRA